ncbi:2-succinyl-5-enolpyruvyl-6-hydroxy-3-cyclohexene-1-carboxylic-acid synthase [Rhodohalobacter mucosus]|uniref:2-succinyl-5-enolpyruvyl-6-hydroxy-3-cyclohexene-1-carboxylate synthase n=1 Tax=Rhodohalobacter mucosus TaxID=2079485 RepID=A0A316TWR0_9BACT|nr:2-succinyl-5-enolpyruvyl-6-hydroxy-3-cyclohexene-1-carboxylic-acid synthase [Rhodohalobacter mucosus]PWN07002.1 2-succinyl-5-enolpyruvyl-6-hydroxy-3-cyclohexene-1-carboxylic-acid synthase [Rhodohalobacter mucosus]
MNSHLKWSSHLFRSLYEKGVRHMVLSPGSRSTPLAMAAAIHKGFQKHVVIDERSAGFMALGIGKATGTPAVLICTSGTAGANYMPAVIEARQSGVPLIVLTADRPPILRGIGSSQTIDQIKLFGDQAIFFHEAGEPSGGAADLKRLSWLARQAVEESIRAGGAAHINLPFRKPLEPEMDDIKTEMTLNSRHPERKSDTNTDSDSDSVRRTLHLPETVNRLIQKAERPLIVAGPANPHHALRNTFQKVIHTLSAPVLMEPGASLQADESLTVNRFEQILRNPEHLESLQPDLIIRFGDQPFTKSLLSAFDAWGTEGIPVIHFVSRIQPQDQSMSSSFSIFCTPDDQIELPSGPYSAGNTEMNWLEKWKEIDKTAKNELERTMSDPKKLSDGHVIRFISNKLRSEWNVMLSNSFIPRDMALFGRPDPHQFVNRGAAGIDGILSTALGIHLASDRPTACIAGDIACLHDSNALLSLRDLKRPFVIIIVNNEGGNIFRMLPVSRYSDYYTEYFETPQNVQFERLAQAHGLTYKFVDTPDALLSLDLQKAPKGALIIECKTDPDASMDIRQRLWNFGSLPDK